MTAGPPGRVLVTGGSGFIGTNLVERLLADGVAVRSLDLAAPQIAAHREVWERVDVRDGAAVADAFAGFAPDAVVHLAARTDLDGTSPADYDANTTGVERVIDAIDATATVRRALMTSSQLVCRIGYRPTDDLDVNPTTEYGRSKVAGEQLVRRRLDRSWVILRPTTIWGPWWPDLYSAFFRQVRAGRYVHPRGLRIERAYGYVGNAVHQIVGLLSAPDERVSGRTLYLSDYGTTPVLEWANEISAAFGRGRVREVPLALLRVGALVGDGAKRAGLELPLTSFRLNNLLTPTSFDMTELAEICGPLPFTRGEGTAITVDWMRSHP